MTTKIMGKNASPHESLVYKKQGTIGEQMNPKVLRNNKFDLFSLILFSISEVYSVTHMPIYKSIPQRFSKKLIPCTHGANTLTKCSYVTVSPR